MFNHALSSPTAESPRAVPEPPLLLRVQDVCDQLNVSRATVQRLLSAGVLPSVKVGRARRVTYVALQQLVDDLADGRVSLGTRGVGGSR